MLEDCEEFELIGKFKIQKPRTYPVIFVSDGQYYWNFLDEFIVPIPLRGLDIKTINVTPGTIKRLQYNQKRRQKRSTKRGIRTCPICYKIFFPKRSDARICHMQACRRAAKGGQPRKKIKP